MSATSGSVTTTRSSEMMTTLLPPSSSTRALAMQRIADGLFGLVGRDVHDGHAGSHGGGRYGQAAGQQNEQCHREAAQPQCSVG